MWNDVLNSQIFLLLLGTYGNGYILNLLKIVVFDFVFSITTTTL